MATDDPELEHRLTVIETQHHMLDGTLKKLDESVNCLRECAVEFKSELRTIRADHLREMKAAKEEATEAKKQAAKLEERLTWWEDKRKQFIALVSGIAIFVPLLTQLALDWIRKHT